MVTAKKAAVKKATVLKLTALADRLVVKPTDQEEATASGLFLPDTAQEKPQEGDVVAVGPGRLTDEGKRVPMELRKGDRIIYSKYAGTEYKDGSDEYLILRESDVLAKVSK